MDPRYGGIDGQPSPYQSSNYAASFSEQPRRGHVRPEIRRTQHEPFLDLHPLIRPHPFHIPHPHPGPYPAPQPYDMHEAIQREIEKERIREEIIISEIARRRVLEAEVRRELMMERELARGSHKDGFPFGSSPMMGFDSPMRLSLLGTRAEGRSLEGRISLSVEEAESGGLETLPFQRGTQDVRNSEVRPVVEVEESKAKEVIVLPKPDINVSGSKRKAMTPPGVDASKLLPDYILKKKAKDEWSCALCQVSTTSELALKEHVSGKKHKSKEAALRAQRSRKNYSIGLFPKNATKSTQIIGTDVPDTEDAVKIRDESFPSKETWGASSKKDDLPPLQEKSNQSEIVIQEEEKKADANKEKYKHWCEVCQVGTYSSKVMNTHKRGRKHLNRLQKSDQHGMAGGNNQKKKVTAAVYHVEKDADETEENKTSENVEEPLDEVCSENPESKDSLEPDNQAPLGEIKVEGGGAVDETKAEEGENVNITKPEDDVQLDEIEVEGGATDETKPKRFDQTKAEEGWDMNITKPDGDVPLDEIEAEKGGELDQTKAKEGGDVVIAKLDGDLIGNVFQPKNYQLPVV